MAGPFQMEVLFETFPEKLDVQALKESIDSLESQEEPCEVSEYKTLEQEGQKVGSFTVQLGELRAAAIIHASPLPEEMFRSTVEVMPLPDPDKETAAKHQAYALTTCLGGEEYHPIESTVLLLKLAMALCEQGALGATNEQNASYLPADILVNTAQAARLVDAEVAFENEASPLEGEEEDGSEEEEEKEPWKSMEDEELAEEEEEEEEPMTLWDSVRFAGDPYYLLANVLPIERDNKVYFATLGHAIYDLPELLAPANDFEDYGQVREVFEDIFSYMMANGPVFGPNQTMAYDDSMTLHFAELPPELAELHGESNRLLVTFEQS